MHLLDQLASHHGRFRWHKCPDGFRWRITREGNRYHGVILNPAGIVVCDFTHVAESRVETIVEQRLGQLRK
jgi:hypothetical protein